MLIRYLYTLLFYLFLPGILVRLYWRGIKAPDYRQRWQERLGYYAAPAESDVVWFHAVSVGEAEAAFPLLKLLLTRYPQRRFLVTTTTPTGSARVRQVLGDAVAHVYLPYDLPVVLNRFFRHFQPKLVVIMEKEIWPNLFAVCAERKIPLFVINARLSERSARAYRKISGLIKPVLASVRLFATQTDADRVRFIEIGASPSQVSVQGNIKFDVSIDQSIIAAGQTLRQKLFFGRFVWIIASSHHGEETIILNLYPRLKARIANLLLLIVPRHPERFQSVKKLCEAQQLTVVMRSEQLETAVSSATDVYIADSIGELKMLYACADLAFVGGSLAPVGGHNVLEPAAAGIPVLFGPQMFNFQEIAEGMLVAEAARQCGDADAICTAVLALSEDTDYRQILITNAGKFIERNQGATERIASIFTEYLNNPTANQQSL